MFTLHAPRSTENCKKEKKKKKKKRKKENIFGRGELARQCVASLTLYKYTTKAAVVGPLAPEFSVNIFDFSDGSAGINNNNNNNDDDER